MKRYRMHRSIPEPELKEFLDFKVYQYNAPSFLEGDPVSVPHRFDKQQDIEIAAFFAAILAWGQRSVAVKKARELMQRMDNQPWLFILEARKGELRRFEDFVHRTFNGDDCILFLRSLQRMYKEYGSLGNFFSRRYRETGDMRDVLIAFRREILKADWQSHAAKHLAKVEANASGKRLNLFLRWMVRKDNGGVDFGLWNDIPASSLYIPLDVHSGNVARKLGLLGRKQNDWKAVEELTGVLKRLDPDDPVKYDFALFGLGIFEEF